MANQRAAEKLALRDGLDAARQTVTAEVRALSEEVRARGESLRRTATGPLTILLAVAGGWLAYRAVKQRRLPVMPLGLLALRWLRPRLTSWFLERL